MRSCAPSEVKGARQQDEVVLRTVCWSQAAMYAKLEKREMGVWEAMAMLGTLREFETALLQEEGTDADLPLPQHAMQTAENCRAAFPDLDWLHLVGLIHSLGKVLAHKQCASALESPASGFSHNPARKGLTTSSAPLVCSRCCAGSLGMQLHPFLGPLLCSLSLCFSNIKKRTRASLEAMSMDCVSSGSLRHSGSISSSRVCLQDGGGAAVGGERGELPGGLPLPPGHRLLPVLQREPRQAPPHVQHQHRRLQRTLRPGGCAHVLVSQRVPVHGAPLTRPPRLLATRSLQAGPCGSMHALHPQACRDTDRPGMWRPVPGHVQISLV